MNNPEPKSFPYPFGSMAQIKFIAEKFIPDITSIHKSEEEPGTLIITCKKDYDKKLLDNFMDEHIPVGIYCKIKV